MLHKYLDNKLENKYLVYKLLISKKKIQIYKIIMKNYKNKIKD